MMSWTGYEVTIRSISPTFIGYNNLGVINQTRYYIPGKNIWAMLTAYLTKNNLESKVSDWSLINGYARAKDYEEVGGKVSNCIKTSYFYPCDKDALYIPEYTENGLKFGNYSKGEFENRFIDSFASTAIDRDTGTALEEVVDGESRGSYHEIEYIKQNTIFKGYIFVNDSFTIDNKTVDKEKLEQILENAFMYQGIGGERNYGFGRFELLKNGFNNLSKGANNSYSIFNDKIKIEDKGELFVQNNSEKHEFLALSHVNLGNYSDLNICGDIEPVVGMEWSNKGPGRQPSPSKICLTPGTKFNTSNFDNKKICIGYHGVWQLHN